MSWSLIGVATQEDELLFVGSILLSWIVVGSCIIIIDTIRARSNIQRKSAQIICSKCNSENDIDRDRVVVCVEIDRPNEAEP